MRTYAAKVLADALAPSLARWSRRRERQILKTGVTLSPLLVEFAESLGIEHCDRLRLEITGRIPFPIPDRIVDFAQGVGLPVFHPAGMCLGRGISAISDDPRLIRHELVHTLQYQSLGGHAEFMRQYVFECVLHGYANAPLELEARDRSVGA